MLLNTPERTRTCPHTPGDNVPVPDAVEPLPPLHVTKVAVPSVTPLRLSPSPGGHRGPHGDPPLPPQVLGAMLGLGLFAVIIAAAIVVLVRRLRLKSE